MKPLCRILRRSMTSARSNQISKNSRAELNFKESNDIPDPFSIIDRNVPGLEHRLCLYEMRRLTDQLELDKDHLKALKLNNLAISSKLLTDSLGFQLSYNITTGFPGLNCPTEVSSSPSVTVRFDFESSKLLDSEKRKIIELFGLDKNCNEIVFSVSDYPFISQNRIRAINILEEIIKIAKNEMPSKYFGHLLSLHESSKTKAEKNTRDFPMEWLKDVKQAIKND